MKKTKITRPRPSHPPVPCGALLRLPERHWRRPDWSRLSCRRTVRQSHVEDRLYTNIIEVKGKYQARLQVKGDGRGGQRKRKQYGVPGILDTALAAALYLAYFKETGIEKCC